MLGAYSGKLIAHGGLITNGFRRAHNMDASSLCPLCGSQEETIGHLL